MTKVPSGDEGLKKESLYKECNRCQALNTQAAANSMDHFATAMPASAYVSVYVKLLTWWMSWINWPLRLPKSLEYRM